MADYYPGPYNVTFPPGEINALLNITIFDDVEPECNETFVLHINRSSPLPFCLDIVKEDILVTIVDNECKQLT